MRYQTVLLTAAVVFLATGCFTSGVRHVRVRNGLSVPILLFIGERRAADAIPPGATFTTPDTFYRGGAMRFEARGRDGKGTLQTLDLTDKPLVQADDGETVSIEFRP